MFLIYNELISIKTELHEIKLFAVLFISFAEKKVFISSSL